MAIARQVITSLLRDGTDMLGTKSLAVKIADESIVSGSLLTVESNHFCVLKSRGAVLNVYETGQYTLTTPDKPLLGSIAQGFFGGNSPWVFEVIYINRSKLLIRSEGVATSAEMAEMSYQVDYYIHVDTKEAALDLITHLPFNGHLIDTREVADYAGPAIEQAINQIVQVTKMEDINEHIHEVRELVKSHLSDFLRTYGITLNDLKILIMPKDERMRKLISLQAIGLTPIEAVRQRLISVTHRLAGFEAESLNVHVDFPLFQRLALPIVSGKTKIPGIKIQDTRIIRLMEVLLHAGTRLNGWRTAQIHQAILTAFALSPETYGLTQLRYDLRKLKAHGLLERDGRRYCYRLTEKGVKIALMMTLFHKRVCGPLANSLFHHRTDQHSTPNTKIETAYHKADKAIQRVVDLLAAA